MQPRSRLAVLTLFAAAAMGCSRIASVMRSETKGYPILVNQAIADTVARNSGLPASNIGHATTMDRRAAEARVETLSNVFRVMGIAMALLPTMGGIPSSPLFLICAESLVTNEKDDWWNNVFLQPGSLRAAVSGKKYCFTENGRVRFR